MDLPTCQAPSFSAYFGNALVFHSLRFWSFMDFAGCGQRRLPLELHCHFGRRLGLDGSFLSRKRLFPNAEHRPTGRRRHALYRRLRRLRGLFAHSRGASNRTLSGSHWRDRLDSRPFPTRTRRQTFKTFGFCRLAKTAPALPAQSLLDGARRNHHCRGLEKKRLQNGAYRKMALGRR